MGTVRSAYALKEDAVDDRRENVNDSPDVWRFLSRYL